MACSDLPCGCQVSPRQVRTHGEAPLISDTGRTLLLSPHSPPWPPPSLYTPKDSLEAEVSQGFLVTPRGKPSGKCFSWQGVTLRRPTAAPEIRVEAEQLQGGGRGRGAGVCVSKDRFCVRPGHHRGECPSAVFSEEVMVQRQEDNPKASPGGNIPCNQCGSYAASASETSVWFPFQFFQASCPGCGPRSRGLGLCQPLTLFGFGETRGIQHFWKIPAKPLLGLGVVWEHQKPLWGPRGRPEAGGEVARVVDPSQLG